MKDIIYGHRGRIGRVGVKLLLITEIMDRLSIKFLIFKEFGKYY
jgi:hypothetical protein